VPGFRPYFVFSAILSLFFSKIALFLANNRETGSYLTAHTTKSNQVLAMIKHQIGSFSWEAGLIRSQLRSGNWALIRFILCFFTPHANEIQRADQFAQGQLHTDRRIGWFSEEIG